MTKAKILAFLAVMAMVLIVPAVAFAQAVPPHIFIGSVTVNGLSAPSGTVVSAVVGGVEQGNATVSSAGSYTLQVSQGSGTDIIFMVDTLTASETATWQQGGADVLNLTAGGVGAASAAGTAGAAGASGAKGPKGDAGAAEWAAPQREIGPQQVGPLLDAEQAVVAAGGVVERVVGRRAHAIVVDGEQERAVGGLQPHLDAHAACVLDGVVERLLRDAVEGEALLVGQRRPLGDGAGRRVGAKADVEAVVLAPPSAVGEGSQRGRHAEGVERRRPELVAERPQFTDDRGDSLARRLAKRGRSVISQSGEVQISFA